MPARSLQPAAPTVTIIGLGRMGERHLRTCLDSGVAVNGIVDVDAAVLEGALRRGLRCAASIAAAPRRWFDGAYVVVALPDTVAADHAARLSGARGVLIEKPSPRWAQALTDARSHRAGTPAQVGLQERYNPAFGAVCEAARAWRGDLAVATVREAVPQRWVSRSPAGLARELLVHDSDLVRRLAVAASHRILKSTVDAASWHDTGDMCELCCVVRFDLPDGTLRWVSNTRWVLDAAAGLQRRIALNNSTHNLTADLMSGTITTADGEMTAADARGGGSPLHAQLSDWLRGCEMTATLQDWHQALQIAAACQSAAQSRPLDAKSA